MATYEISQQATPRILADRGFWELGNFRAERRESRHSAVKNITLFTPDSAALALPRPVPEHGIQ